MIYVYQFLLSSFTFILMQNVINQISNAHLPEADRITQMCSACHQHSL